MIFFLSSSGKMLMKHNSWTRNWSVYFLWNDYALEVPEDVEILTIKQLMTTTSTTRPPKTNPLTTKKDSNSKFTDFSMEISFNISINVFEIFRQTITINLYATSYKSKISNLISFE